MTKADELWHQHTGGMGVYMTYDQFLAALHEYGQAVRKRDAEICRGLPMVPGTGLRDFEPNGGDCAAAISKEPLP